MFYVVGDKSVDYYQCVLAEGLIKKQNALQNPPLGSFYSGIKKISSNLFILKACDPDHKLACEMILEVRDSFPYIFHLEPENHLIPILACNFPCIDTQHLKEKIGTDNYLECIFMVWFQLQTLEQLFLFCESKGAVNLVLNFGEYNLDYIEIYRHFLNSERKVLSPRGELTQIIIPSDVTTYDNVIDLMDHIEQEFRETLWRTQKANPAIRNYIKSQTL